jgi:hypothetical protein
MRHENYHEWRYGGYHSERTPSSAASAANLFEPETMPKHGDALDTFIVSFTVVNLASMHIAAGLRLTKCIMCVHPHTICWWSEYWRYLVHLM